MAIRRKPPHPARIPIILLVLLALVIAGLVALSQSVEEVPTRPIEVDVTRAPAQ
ncbi:hypothetical protein ACFQPG_08495 [Sphingomonas sp. GCM10030256]|uniref:hypothetical protein n=1 Tax=Sphingomonas sp. GCM10030256 TaxID=3273427 RepID=UPI003621B132